MKAKLIGIAAFSLVLTGCGKGPGDVVLEMNEAVCSSGDVSAMMDYVTPDSRQTVSMLESLGKDPSKRKQAEKQMRESCETPEVVAGEEIEGTRAMVYFESGKTQHLRKIDDEWKVVFKK